MNSSRARILQKLKYKKLKYRDDEQTVKQTDKRIAPTNKIVLQEIMPNLDLFIKKLELSRVEVYQTTSPDWAQTLIEIVKKKNIQSMMLGQNKPYHAEASLALTRHAPNTLIHDYKQPYEDIKKKLFHQTQACLTEATSAISNTGTLLIIPDQNEPRMMSLIPEIHIVLLSQKNLYPTFQHLVQDPPWETIGMPTNILFVSSPSKTADIQQTIAYGAHGPKELIVIISKET